jgi:lipopolysaccharide heptosyltransferase II
MTTPAISALREGLPSAHISYVVETPFRELIEGNPHVDRTFVLPQRMGANHFLNAVRAIRKERFDVAIDFHGGPTASLITLFSGAAKKIGYRIKYKSFIYDIAIPRGLLTGHIHSVENHINLVRALGLKVPVSPPLLLPESSVSDKKKIHTFFSDKGLQGSKVVVIHVGAGNEFREWGAKRWAKFLSMLVKKHKAKILLIGTSDDAAIADQIHGGQSSSVYSLAGKLTLGELKELIAKSCLYVGPDSGPMHIAASTSTPIVALFGPNLSAYNAPWQANSVVIEKQLDCRPCDQRKCISGDFRCMRTITPEEVFSACIPYL